MPAAPFATPAASVESPHSAYVTEKLFKKPRLGPESLSQEFRRYLREPTVDTDTLEWWKIRFGSYPNLSRMARDYLGVPGTEASAERNFSGARRLITDERASLSDETIQAVQCLKSWLEF